MAEQHAALRDGSDMAYRAKMNAQADANRKAGFKSYWVSEKGGHTCDACDALDRQEVPKLIPPLHGGARTGRSGTKA